MFGGVIPIVEYREFNHSFLAAGSGAYDIQLAPYIPVAEYSFIGVSARVHARNLAASCTYQIILRGVNPSAADGSDFVFATDLGSTPATTGSTNPTTVPGLVQLSTPVTSLQQPGVRVILRALPASAGAVTLYILLSVDLVVRSGT